MKYLMPILLELTKVNPVTGDKIVRQRYVTQSEIHKYRGDFECIGNKWRLHTETGFYDISSNQNHYYIKDNQGSIVTVVSENGSIEEQTAYYPTGVPYRIFDRQPVTDRKHIGNEWLAFNGLNTYDNTARYHYPIIPSYDTIDPNAEDYPGISPYAHCAGNPRNVIDPSGMDPVYDLNGNYLGNTKEGFTGVILIYTGNEAPDFSAYSAEEITSDYPVVTLDEFRSNIENDAISKIFTDIISKFDNTKVFDVTFSLKTIEGGKIHYRESESSTWNTEYSEHRKYIKISGNGKTTSYENTVENTVSSVLVHEWYGHGIKYVSDEYNNHSKAYEYVQKSPFWNKTTDKYKEFVLRQYNIYKNKENEKRKK